jgi:hypothetical protein
MKKVLLVGIVMLAATPAFARTWYVLNYAQGMCENSKTSPEVVYNMISSPLGHGSGMTIERIRPNDVIKDDKGNIHVHMTGTRDGTPMELNFFTSKEACDSYVRANNIVPQQADRSDIN